MKKPLTTIAALMVAITLIGADAPCLIPFQGRLTDQQGVAYTEGQYTLIFNLYDTAVGGTSLWTERHEKVGVINGMVNLFLGSINSLDGQDFSKTRYLGITVDADGNANSYDPEMVPRQMIIPAFHAQNSNKLQGMDWSAVLSGDKTFPLASRYINPDRIHDGTITSNKLHSSVLDLLQPAGMIMPFAGPVDKIPNGWLLCDGRIERQNAYPRLYDAIGNSWGYTNYLDEAATVECMELQTLGTYNQRWNEAGTTSGHCESTGSIFGAAPGQGRYVVANSCWQVDKGTFYSNIDSSQDHVYDFTNVGPGTYRILFTKMEGKSSYYNLYLTYDGGSQAIAIPDDSILSTAEWTESPDIVVSESIQQINAQWISRSAPKDKCIPAIQLIRVIPPSQAVYAKEGEFRLPNAENWAMWPTNQPPAGKLNFIIKY